METTGSPVEYPQYRKYAHGKTYFKIISSSEFEELQLLGEKCIIYTFIVRILPDRNYIHDLTFDYEKHWVKIEEEEYEAVRSKCKASKS